MKSKSLVDFTITKHLGYGVSLVCDDSGNEVSVLAGFEYGFDKAMWFIDAGL